MNKRKILKITFFILIGIALVTGLSYAYIYFGFAGTETNLIKAGCLKIELSETGNLSLNNAIALSDDQGKESEPYEFTITNSCNSDAYYETIFNKLTTSSSDVDSTTKLYLTGDGYLEPSIMNSLDEVTLTDKPSDVANSYLLDTGYIKAGESKKYYLRMWIAYDTTSYGNLDGRIIVNASAKKGPSFASNTMGYQVYKSNVISYSANLEGIAPTTEETSGLYQVENTNNEYEYYYRGNVINNYVKFGKYANETIITYTDSTGNSQTVTHLANEDMVWRIVKINSDGSLKLILDDVIGTSAFNSTTNDSKYTGYVYDTEIDSTIKAVVDNFYSTNLLTNYGSYIKDEIYCSDNTSMTTNSIIYYGGYTRNISSHNASSSCEGGTVTGKIGLITVDELSYAGALNSTTNSSYYLQKNINGFWTMSPAKYDASIAYDFVSTNTKSIDISNVTTVYAVRPVITLQKDYELNGNGTSTTPYTVGDKITSNLDQSGVNTPRIVTNMVPVYYDSTNDTWRVADKTNSDTSYQWYDYTNKIWANAVMVKETGTQTRSYYNNQANVGEAVSMDDILAMYVWIPRFVVNTGGLTTQAYFESIRGTATTGTGSNGCASGVTCYLTPGAINISFVNSSTTAHDAFTFGTQNLSGIWVGKFETGHTTLATSSLDCINETCSNANGIIIKPNVISLRANNVSNFFYAGRSMSQTSNSFGFNTTTDTTLDTHMMKNNEWGALAYLTQSNYGRCTNGVCTEVTINNCSTSITGIGADTVSADSSTTSCTTDANKYNGSYGVLASTTGNIYGIYDMSGGAYEYVMGNYNNTISLSGFTALPNSKYYNTYTNNTAYTTANLQHALIETQGWYNDYACFVDGSYPWIVRSGRYSDSGNAGLFYFHYNNAGGGGISFRSSVVK